MLETTYLQDIVVLFGAALVVIAVCRQIRIPTLVGFLLTGTAVGPFGLGLVRDPHNVAVFAEFGVIFLLFGIGLEFSADRLRKLGRIILLGGGVQALMTVLLFAGLSHQLGFPGRQAIFLGFVIALSSTAIVLKLYTDRNELEAPYGEAATGILLFQDFLIVPLLLVVPVLAGKAAAPVPELIVRFGGGLAVVALVFVLGRSLLPRFLFFLVRMRVRELLVIGALFACLAGALVTEALGFSLALGAFLAGVLIGESDYRHQALAETVPFRDVFNSMFFISVGMLLKLDFVIENAMIILLAGIVTVLVKALLAGFATAVLSYPFRVCFIAGLALAQIGEFSFVLIRAGKQHDLLDPFLYQLAIAIAVLTMVLTPFLITWAPRLADAFATLLVKTIGRPSLTGPPDVPPDKRLSGHVVIVGFGLNGRNLAQVLRGGGIPYVIVELNPRNVRRAKAANEPIIYGDVTRRDILETAGIERAHMVVLAISDQRALERSICVIRALNPSLPIIARARYVSEIEELRRQGASFVVAEEFETSIEILTAVLERLHIPGNVIRLQSRLLREDGYEMLRHPAVRPAGLSDKVMRALAEGITDTFLIMPKHFAVGRTIKQLGIREHTGATIIAIVRGKKSYPNPAADLELQAGDVLALIGSHMEIEQACDYLEVGKAGA